MQILTKYQDVSNYFKENNWHEINEEPLTEDELAILGNEKPEKEAGPVSNLPVAYKQLTGDIDPTKKTIVISHTEDLPHLLEGFCSCLDEYIQYLPEETKNKYNILVAVSTSAEDMLRALKKLKQIIDDGFDQAKFLFLNDMSINKRTSNELFRSIDGGENIIKIAKRFIGNSALIRTLIQSDGNPPMGSDFDIFQPSIQTWGKEIERNNAIGNFTNGFSSEKTPWIMGKIGKDFTSTSLPIDAFLRFLHQEENNTN